jgi:CBS-domain-containing membrane protein
MRADVQTVKLDAPLGDLIAAFSDWRLSALAVVDDENHLKGIISYVDVLKALEERFAKGSSHGEAA